MSEGQGEREGERGGRDGAREGRCEAREGEGNRNRDKKYSMVLTLFDGSGRHVGCGAGLLAGHCLRLRVRVRALATRLA